MSVLDGRIGQDGLIVKVQLAPTELELERRRRDPHPKPLEVIELRAIVDTGADHTFVKPFVFATLGLVVTNEMRFSAAGGERAAASRAHVDFSVLAEDGSTVHRVPFLAILDGLAAQATVDCLLGRDVLRDCVLLVDGPAQEFSMTFGG